MNKIDIMFNLESPQENGKTILIWVQNKPAINLHYKFIIGCDGTWNTISDFSSKDSVEWTPKEDGKYIIMVQAKDPNSDKPFDYISKVDYIIGKIEENIINGVYIDKSRLDIGEKLTVTVESNKSTVMFRYWIKEDENWQLAKEYSADNTFIWSVKEPGLHKVLVESRGLNSSKTFDDFKIVEYEVLDIDKVEIKDFKCLITDMLVDSELIFQVDAFHDDNRMVLYKFLKIDIEGRTSCIQDYSTKRVVSYIEKEPGEYKILCLAKDMYSTKEYDDRAIINYKVRPYNPICIQSFTTDVSSPQICETDIVLKAAVKGGKDLLYRYIIEGNHSEDSGYIKNNNYVWKVKKPGKYKINLWVKDASFDGNYEATKSIDFVIDEISSEPVKIEEVVLSKNKKLLKGESENIKVIASGGTELRYEFIVKKENKVLEKMEYCPCNWVNFIPEEGGTFEIEIRVKDKYSKRIYDSHSIIYIDVYDFMPANIKYILLPPREYYMIEDNIVLNVIIEDTKNILIKYVLKIDGHEVEKTEYVPNKSYEFIPKYSGMYEVEVYAKNKISPNEFDSKRTVKISVNDSLPITNTKISCDKINLSCSETITFTVSNDGGKEVLYEFYVLEKGDWSLAQKYSRKNYYTFMPFTEGKYSILVLCKSQHKKCFYEDYDMIEFNVGMPQSKINEIELV